MQSHHCEPVCYGFFQSSVRPLKLEVRSWWNLSQLKIWAPACWVSLVLVSIPLSCPGAVIFGLAGGTSLADGTRWDAGARTFTENETSYERSLEGGLRYSLEGGSYTNYRDQFTWSSTPTVANFTAAVTNAFSKWQVVDPVSNFGTQLNFVADLSTPVDAGSFNSVNFGAEIDLFAGPTVSGGTSGEASFLSKSVGGGLTLTSGTTGYGGFAISGADITMNDTGVTWDLSTFEVILTHEIGHTIGLGDVEDFSGNGFIDNNYSGADPLGTLTDSWVHLVDPLNPGASTGLFLFNVPNADPGIDTPGVDILMEGNIPSIFFTSGAQLQNDDFGGRQFLYPELTAVPEPTTAVLFIFAVAAMCPYRSRRIYLNPKNHFFQNDSPCDTKVVKNTVRSMV